jgi:3-deoxy-D-manno-octulosonic-acid transferase
MRAMFWLYNFALLPFYPLLFAYTLWRCFVQKKSLASFRGQWGYVPRAARASCGSTPIIWIHAVSVGEQIAARPIARALKGVLPSCCIALSCTTDTGFQTAQAALKNGEADTAFYFPLDLPLPVSRALKAVAPDVFIAVETELWPNFLHMAHARGVLCFLANGRVSDKSLKSAPRLKFLWRWMISNLDLLLMRGESDAKRMKEICDLAGAPDAASKVLAPGDVKLDDSSSREDQEKLRARWREKLKIGGSELLWVCGSTHPAKNESETGEEEIALRVYLELKKIFPLRLLLAPRHIERVPEVLLLCEKMNVGAMRRSEIQNSRGDEVLILDTVGELSGMYAAADVAFVGGSLIARGGHNVLEPVLCGVPVLFGPHMMNFREAASLVEEAPPIGSMARNENELHAQLEYWLASEEQRIRVFDRMQQRIAPHRGAAGRIAQHIAEKLKSKS